MATAISPTDWGLESSLGQAAVPELEALGLDRQEMELRCRRNTLEWLPRYFNEEVGGFYGYYDPRSRSFAAPQTVNLIAPSQQSGRFLVQSQTHDFAPKYDQNLERWVDSSWQSFGRVIVALLALAEMTQDQGWSRRAMAWAEHGMKLQAPAGCFHLVHRSYYSSDVAADEMRALARVHHEAEHLACLEAALRFADWHVRTQREDGSRWVAVDASRVPVSEYVGPGDVPNIAIALLSLHRATGELRYLLSALRAIHYSLQVQATPESKGRYLKDPNVLWGFWSWPPYYDYPLSPDQSTHHVRGLWFFRLRPSDFPLFEA
jgi:hypothetical protein